LGHQTRKTSSPKSYLYRVEWEGVKPYSRPIKDYACDAADKSAICRIDLIVRLKAATHTGELVGNLGFELVAN